MRLYFLFLTFDTEAYPEHMKTNIMKKKYLELNYCLMSRFIGT